MAFCTLVLTARDIPSETRVRKVTGECLYTLKRDIKVYYSPVKDGNTPENQVIKLNGMVYLISDTGSINGYPEDSIKFAVDFDTTADLIEFCGTILEHD